MPSGARPGCVEASPGLAMLNLGSGFAALLSVGALVSLAAGTLLGLVLSSLPGIGPAVAIALLLPLSYHLNVADALLFYASLYQAAEYGGSISAISLGVPGGAGSAATVPDGHAMSLAGRPGRAFGYSLWSAVAGSFVGLLALGLISGWLAKVGLSLPSETYTSLAVLSLVVVSRFSSSGALLGTVSCGLGLLLSTVGTNLATGTYRFTFGQPALFNGIGLEPLLIGLFAISTALGLLLKGDKASKAEKKEKVAAKRDNRGGRRVWLNAREFRNVLPSVLVGSVLGTVLGAIPGFSGALPPWLAYNAEKARARKNNRFGSGDERGIAAPESCNGAVMHATLIPALTLGLPGTSTSALIMTALIIGGITPGPLLLVQHEVLFSKLVAGLAVAALLLWVLGILVTSLWARVVSVSPRTLAVLVLVFSFVGAYVGRQSVSDVVVACACGIGGYAIRRMGFDIPAVVVSFIVGSILEKNLQRSLVLTNGSWLPFISTPSSLFLLIAAAVVTMSMLGSRVSGRRGSRVSGRRSADKEI